jgi:ribonucleotide monophosphatase NagD (HAD superfamily)
MRAPPMFAAARDRLRECSRIVRARIAAAGDSLASDLAGATRAGLDAALVLSGTSRMSDLLSAQVEPYLVLPSIATLRLDRPLLLTLRRSAVLCAGTLWRWTGAPRDA